MQDIQVFSERVVHEFRPQKIILFGSYAYGQPTEDSDVDLLIIFAGRRSKADKSLEIRTRLDPRFPLDLLTRSAGEVAKRIAWNDWFLQEVMEKGKVLYESGNTRMDQEG